MSYLCVIKIKTLSVMSKATEILTYEKLDALEEDDTLRVVIYNKHRPEENKVLSVRKIAVGTSTYLVAGVLPLGKDVYTINDDSIALRDVIESVAMKFLPTDDYSFYPATEGVMSFPANMYNKCARELFSSILLENIVLDDVMGLLIAKQDKFSFCFIAGLSEWACKNKDIVLERFHDNDFIVLDGNGNPIAWESDDCAVIYNDIEEAAYDAGEGGRVVSLKDYIKEIW